MQPAYATGSDCIRDSVTCGVAHASCDVSSLVYVLSAAELRDSGLDGDRPGRVCTVGVPGP